MFRFVALMLLIWLAYCLTPLGDIMSDLADTIGYAAPFQKKELVIPKTEPKRGKW